MSGILTITVTRFQCPHCMRTGANKSRITRHTKTCWLNPDAHGCHFCRHHCPGNDASCAIDSLPDGIDYVPAGCALWEPNSEIDGAA